MKVLALVFLSFLSACAGIGPRIEYYEQGLPVVTEKECLDYKRKNAVLAWACQDEYNYNQKQKRERSYEDVRSSGERLKQSLSERVLRQNGVWMVFVPPKNKGGEGSYIPAEAYCAQYGGFMDAYCRAGLAEGQERWWRRQEEIYRKEKEAARAAGRAAFERKSF